MRPLNHTYKFNDFQPESLLYSVLINSGLFQFESKTAPHCVERPMRWSCENSNCDYLSHISSIFLMASLFASSVMSMYGFMLL